ncbi:RHS repeat-associated core domain-containing protein [Pseudomonas coronafaciens]|uniref:RHS repeat-associated core domain-containing protein n=1 Tax=Pseudomonas coronafaciens TaxID=53409 RepID=UPI003996174E
MGNGYRAYNPVLMRFHSQDSLSPFGEGGLNAYAYGEGDSVNRVDPTGHINIGKFFRRVFGISAKKPPKQPVVANKYSPIVDKSKGVLEPPKVAVSKSAERPDVFQNSSQLGARKVKFSSMQVRKLVKKSKPNPLSATKYRARKLSNRNYSELEMRKVSGKLSPILEPSNMRRRNAMTGMRTLDLPNASEVRGRDFLY